MSINLCNYGTVQGNLARDPKVFENSDGSKKVYLTVACRNNYTGKDGSVGVEYVDLRAFVPKGGSMGALGYLRKGTHVTMAYAVVNNSYKKDGKTVYEQYLQVYNSAIVLPPKAPDGDGFSDEGPWR